MGILGPCTLYQTQPPSQDEWHVELSRLADWIPEKVSECSYYYWTTLNAVSFLDSFSVPVLPQIEPIGSR